MDIKLHKTATTTPRIRQEIQQAPASTSDSELARRYRVSCPTIARWRHRTTQQDRSHTRHNLLTTLSPIQEEIVVALREYLRLSVDDLLKVAREFLHPSLSRSALERLMKRRGLPSLATLYKQEKAAQKPPHKPFKDYEPGYVHVDVKYLPQMPDEERKRYLFVAIDRATRWVYLEIRHRQSAKDAEAFLQHVRERAPFEIKTLLTDNGKTFTDRFAAGGERQPTGRHRVDQFCARQGIDHRLIPPYRPQTNGMVERFNGRISDVLNTHRFDSRDDLEATLKRYNWLYNHHIHQKALHHRTPIEAMKQWQQERPDLFWKRVINHTGPDI
ncbi:IS481 family transposase [Pistricoccus aurantiacus]|uniref:IS481 family transposase n=1 Tax=Pistricoccus aurantiacus TaxID=1883414 RepID=A0A5B8SQ13_9GAMM|nr:IS481 family transposase [Pistricoccus aurantiacus]QEA38284.1 IS481 family transposase [Pistricoccus aurantiacus]